ncbi:MAG: MFS transporter [Coriobacteriia bacterium]|nr:MFS transporter [Coriobacteriia bacterium]
MSTDVGGDTGKSRPLDVTGAVEVSKGAYKRLLSSSQFRRLWWSQFVSGVGDWLVIGFLMPLVTSLSGGSSFAVAGIMIAKIIPALVFSSVIGALVDRFDRRRTMIAADLTRAGLALGLLFTNSVYVIYFVVMVMEVASLFHLPAKNSLIPYIVDEKDIAAANGLSYTTQQASMVVGLAASGGILAAFEAIVRTVLDSGLPLVGSLVGPFAPALLGPRAGVILDSLTFLVSAAAILGIHVRAKAVRAEAKLDLSLLGHDAIESYRFLSDHDELRAFLVTIGFAILGGGTLIPAGLVHVQQNLVGGVPIFEDFEFASRLAAAPQTFILLFMAVGMMAGALIVPRLAGRLSLQLMFLGGVWGFGIAMFGFASVELYWVAGLFATAAGFCIATVTVAGNTYVIYTVSDEIRGRVFTALESVVRVSLLLSMIVMAPLGDIAAAALQRLLDARQIPAEQMLLTGSQVAMQLASLLVVAAGVYALRRLNWRANGRGVAENA